jgi:hypothetical protein
MSNLITFQIEGAPSEDGHMPLSDFIYRLEQLLLALNAMDRIVGQTAQPTLYYRIVDASHHSPISLTIEPVIKKTVRHPEPGYIRVRHTRFFRELSAIQRNEPLSPEMDYTTLEHVRELVDGVGRDFTNARISNDEAVVALDSTFETNVRRLLNEEDASYGNEEGMLEALNIHGKPTFWIYPRIGPERIRCDFLPGTKDQIKENIGKYVRAEGVKYFRPNSPFPYRIAVREFTATSDDDATYLKDIGGISPGATGELSSVDFVRKIRDEWE